MPDLITKHLSIPQAIKDTLEELKTKYEKLKFDSKGAVGHTFFGRNRVLSNEVAIKFYYWGGETRFHAEPKALMQIQSPNVLPVHDAGYADGEFAYFVTPYCSGEDLEDLLAKSALGSIIATDLTAHILQGLAFLHQARFVHRDIKPLNIFLGDGPIAIIGDFGSLKRVPENSGSVPATSLARIYCPPESVGGASYSFSGDLYQVGIVLYQLLGGFLPYDEYAWLSSRERTRYDALQSDADQSIYWNQCIDKKIAAGRIVDMNSIPFWVAGPLKAIVKRACQPDPAKRFETAAAFRAKLHEVRSSLLDWALIDGIPTLRGPTSYRINSENGDNVVEKKAQGGWRKDNSFVCLTQEEIIAKINRRSAK